MTHEIFVFGPNLSGRDGKTAILEEGASLDKVSMSAKDLQFIESRDFQRYDIAMFFGVPPEFLAVM